MWTGLVCAAYVGCAPRGARDRHQACRAPSFYVAKPHHLHCEFHSLAWAVLPGWLRSQLLCCKATPFTAWPGQCCRVDSRWLRSQGRTSRSATNAGLAIVRNASAGASASGRIDPKSVPSVDSKSVPRVNLSALSGVSVYSTLEASR